MSDIDRILHTIDARIKVQNKHLDRLGDQLETIITLLSPAPMPEDAPRAVEDPEVGVVPNDPVSPQGDPVLDDVRGRSEDCDHDWPQYELKAKAQCLKCGLPYGEWSVE